MNLIESDSDSLGWAEFTTPDDRSALEKKPVLNLDDCMDIALGRNQRRTVSSYAVRMAQSQHQMAVASFWPTVMLNSTVSRLDDNPNFIFPHETSSYLIDGLGPVPLHADVTIPAKEVQVMDRDSLMTSMDVVLPIYTGGIRSAIVDQAKWGVEAAKEAARRSDLEVIFDVKRMYYGVALAQKLLLLGNESLSRLTETLSITENFYLVGSGKVTKLDYLRHQVIVDLFRSGIAQLESNVEIAKAALVNTMGLSWESSIQILDQELPYNRCPVELPQLVGDLYRYSPDWKQLDYAVGAMKSKIREEQGNRLPKVGLTGTLSRWDNAYDAGIATRENKENWGVGLTIQIPLFNGFLTTRKIQLARERLEQLRAQQILLEEGLALKVKHIFLLMMGYQKQEQSTREAWMSAEQNRELSERAYQNELIEARDLIEAQFLEAFSKALYQKVLFNHIESGLQLDFVIGAQVQQTLLPES